MPVIPYCDELKLPRGVYCRYIAAVRSVCFFTGMLALADFIGYQLQRDPRNALGSEVFGHEKGAFNGAHIERKGLIETPDGGTLFLDEIGDGPPSLQVRFLRFLQEQRIQRSTKKKL